MQFTERTVMLTGAAGNLGRAVAAAFAAAGANLVLLDLKRGSLQESERQLVLETDLLDAQSVQAAETMAAELREKNINVNCVLPTIIDTPENRAAMPKADPKRWVAPADLAQVILFLSSDAARAIHGAALPVTGLS